MPADDSLKNAIDSFVMSLEEEANSSKKIQPSKEEETPIEKNGNDLEKKPSKIRETSGEDFGKVVEVTRKIIEKISGEENLKIENDTDESTISVYGRDLSIVIGKNGKNIDAIEYIVNLIAKRKKLSESRILIDIKDYRKKNSEKIRKMALKMAQKAIAEGRKIALRPMPPYERKVVHDLLSKVKEVRTRSRDNEPNRRIVIYPVENKAE